VYELLFERQQLKIFKRSELLGLFMTIKSNKIKISVDASGILSSIVHSHLVYEIIRFIATFTAFHDLAYLPAD